MAYQVKYWYQSYTLNGDLIKVEIQENSTGTVIAEEVSAMASPISFNLPTIDSKFQPVRGTGCDIKLNSTSNMKFLTQLQFSDPKKYMVVVKRNTVPTWYGYLNSELVGETYSAYSDYDFNLAANDGMALLDRYSFVDNAGNNISTMISLFDIVVFIFNALGLPFNYIHTNLSTTFPQYVAVGSPDQSNILKQTYINTDNFYDEDGIPMTLRQVLEGILMPYGAFIQQMDGNLMITDIHTLKQATPHYFNTYVASTGVYSTRSSNIASVYNIPDLDKSGNGSGIEFSGGKNKQVIKYSPYPIIRYIENSISTPDEFLGRGTELTSPYGFQYIPLGNNKHWTEDGSISATPAYFMEVYNTEFPDHQTVLAIPSLSEVSVTYNSILISKEPTYINCAGPIATTEADRINFRSFIDIKGEALFFVENGESSKSVSLRMRIKIGNYYLVGNGSNYFWSNAVTGDVNTSFPLITSSDTDPVTKAFNSEAPLVDKLDKWVQLGKLGKGLRVEIPAISGQLTVEVFNYMWTTTSGFNVEEVWLKNLSISFSDINGAALKEEDMQYVGYLDRTFASPNTEVSLICGTEVCNTDRGQLRHSSGIIIDCSRGINSNYRLEELLLGSYCSNYKTGFYKITQLPLVASDFNGRYPLFTDNTNLPGRIFMPGGYTLDTEQNTILLDLQEIEADVLTINSLL